MPPRKKTVKKRMCKGPETERRLAFILASQLYSQDTQQQRPFSETTLGRLPGEIRDMIFEHLLVAPPSQATRYLRVPDAAFVNPEETEARRSHVAPLQKSELGKVSYVAILQTCRQIYEEAYHVFYAKNAFHFTSVPVLIAFLKGIGPTRRAELTTLQLEGLVVDQAVWDKDVLDSYCLENNIGSVERKELEAERWQSIHPQTHKVTELLDGCKNLSRLILEMRTHERFDYFFFLKTYLDGTRRPVVYIVDNSRWVVRWPCTKEDEKIDWDQEAARIEETVDKWYAYEAVHPVPETEGLQQVVVDIFRGPEVALGKGYESWVATN